VNDFEEFWRMMRETKERDGFRPHNRGYYEKMLTSLGKMRKTASLSKDELSVKLFLAEYGGRTVAAILSLFSETRQRICMVRQPI